MLASLVTALILLAPQAEVDEADDDRAWVRQVLPLLAEMPMSDEVVEAYQDLHHRAWRLGDAETAHEAVDRIVAWWVERDGAESSRLATQLNDLGVALKERGDYAGARTLYERSVTVLEAVHGPDDPMVALSLSNLGNLLKELGDYDGARSLYERSLSIRETAHGPEHLEMAYSFNELGNLHSDLGDFAKGRSMHERALAIREAALGPEHKDVATSLHNLANLFGQLGDYARARPLYERAQAIWEATLGPNHLRVATSLSSQAGLLDDLGDFAGARSLHERVLAIREEALGPGHPSVATSLENLAIVLQRLGDLSGAQPLFERALAIREAVYGSEHPSVVRTCTNLGVLLRDLGHYAQARSLLERSLATFEATLGPGHQGVAAPLESLAAVLMRLGDHAGSRQLYERSLSIQEAGLGPTHPKVAGTLHNLAILLGRLDDLVAARSLFERAVAIKETALGPEHPSVATSLHGLGTVLQELGDLSGAQRLYERSLAISEAALGPEHRTVAGSLSSLADLLRDLGDYEGARPLYERALTIREAALGPAHPSVSISLRDLARVHLDLREPEVAFAYAGQLTGRRGQVRRILATLTEGESHLYLAQQKRSRYALLAAAGAAGDVSTAYAAVLDAKGQVARLTLQTRAQIRDTLDPETLALIDTLARLQARLSRLALETEVRNREAHEALLASLLTKRDERERELRRQVPLTESAAVTPDAVAALLPDGSAVVDLLVHPGYVPARFQDEVFMEKGHWSEPRVSAWVVRAGEAGPRYVDLGPVAVIEAAVSAFLEDLVARRGVSVVEERSGRAVNAELRALVWDPLTPHLDDVETVFVSTDGVLGTLPYETLADESGTFLVEQFAFVYPTDVASMVERPESVTPLGDTDAPLLSVGGVDFRRRASFDGAADVAGSRDSADRGGGSSRDISADALRGSFNQYWGRLPATEYESQVVRDMHEDALREDSTRLLLQGAEATEERLKAEMPRHAILHLATHGFFQPEGLPSMWEQALDAVGGERGMQMTESAARLTGLHPGLLSGLVLAGANRPPDEDEDGDDGYLTASEVTLLDLSAVDLVVLSACETGLGRPQSGEGLLGLRRAFHMAGADTVISSLWSVKDESTSELMQGFYANLFFKGMGRHEALRAAQLAMLAMNRMEHGDALPSTWGAFVLSGEWR